VGPSFGRSGCTAALDLLTDTTTCISTSFGPLVAHGDTAYLSDSRVSPGSLRAFDLAQAGFPTVRTISITTARTLEISPNGEVLAARGSRIDAATFVQTGRIPTGGLLAFGANGANYGQGSNSRPIGDPPGGVYPSDALTTQALALITMPCPFVGDNLYSVMESTPTGGLVLAYGNHLCISDPLTPTEIPEPPLQAGPLVDLGSPAHAVEVDIARGRAYVSVPFQNRVVVIDVATGDELERRFFRYPQGLALSPDGSRLFVALGQSTGVAVWNLVDDTVTDLTISELDAPGASDVVSPTDNVILVSVSNTRTCAVAVDLTTDERTCVVDASVRSMVSQGNHVYLSASPDLFKIDVSLPGFPIVHQVRDFLSPRFDNGSFNSDGSVMIAWSQTFDPNTLELTNQYGGSVSTFGPDDNAYAYVPWLIPGGRSIHQFDPVSGAPLGETPDPCSFLRSTDPTVFTSTGDGNFLLGSANEICLTGPLVPEKGALRVTTSPALPSQITVDGVPRDTWGLTWVDIGVGGHEVCFSDIAGWTTPPCETVVVTAGATAVVQGLFTQRGFLRVQTSPPVGSTISVDGVPRNDWGMWTDIEPGSHEVCFGAVAGFDAPACEIVDVIAGATTAVTGAFAAGPGAGPTGDGLLRVTTNPAVPSQITVDGEIRDTWGLTWLKLGQGQHTVCFEDVTGWTTPTCESLFVIAGQTSAVQGEFVRRGVLRVTTSPATPTAVFLDGVPRNNWGMWTDIEPGFREICWEPIAGSGPGCQTVEVVAGSLTSVTGSFGP